MGWQGWVDHCARPVLVPTWKTMWLVVYLDVRRNTNPSVKDMATCSRCLSQQATPHFVTSFPCRQCQTEILVLPNLQLALYAPRRDGGRASSHMILSEAPLPFVVETIPQRADFVRVAELDNPTYTNSVNALLQGNVSRAVQNTAGSARTHGLSIQTLGADKRTVLSEYCIRVASAEDSVRLKDIFVAPLTSVAEKVGVTRPLQQGTFPVLPLPLQDQRWQGLLSVQPCRPCVVLLTMTCPQPQRPPPVRLGWHRSRRHTSCRTIRRCRLCLRTRTEEGVGKWTLAPLLLTRKCASCAWRHLRTLPSYPAGICVGATPAWSGYRRLGLHSVQSAEGPSLRQSGSTNHDVGRAPESQHSQTNSLVEEATRFSTNLYAHFIKHRHIEQENNMR